MTPNYKFPSFERAKALADAAPRRQPHAFLAQKTSGVGELYLYDAIGPAGGGIGAKDVTAALAALQGAKVLNVYINSPGGDVFEGIAIYNQLARFPGEKRVHVDGIAASIASVVAMIGDEVVMGEAAQMMIHRAWALAIGNSADLRSTAELLDKLDTETIVPAYSRSRQPRDRLLAMMAAETWMGSAQAVELGFADRIAPLVAAEPEAVAFTAAKLAHLALAALRR